MKLDKLHEENGERGEANVIIFSLRTLPAKALAFPNKEFGDFLAFTDPTVLL